MNDCHPPVAIPVAVVAMSAIFPGEPGLAGYWRTITGGRDAIGDVPPSYWRIEDYFDPVPAQDKTYCKRGGFIDPVPFDPVQFGLPPNALPATDSAQLLALVAANQLLDTALRAGTPVDRDRVDVVLGVASTTELAVQMGARLQQPIWRKAMLEHGLSDGEADDICRTIADHYVPWQESTFPGLLGNVVAGRIANRLNLGGSNYVTDAACASSLAALQVALHRLYLYEADLVLTGGVDALNGALMYTCFTQTPALSPTGDCRPFSAAADGTIIGEGVGMLALKRLADAERDGDPIHAVIRGLGASSDGRASSVYAPRSEGQASALARAYDRAGYLPGTVELLEAHGTATRAGDVAEFAALKTVFAALGRSRCALGSVKSQIGHTKAAAGAAGLIKTVLALQHSTLPATLKVDRPNPELGLADSPFYVNTTTRPWIRSGESPRRAAVSSFGFGGTNFHVTLEEYRGPHRAKRLRVLPSELVLLSASGEAELAERCEQILAACRAGEDLAKIASDAALEFCAQHTARAGVVATDTDSLHARAERLCAALGAGSAADLGDPDIAVGLGPVKTGRTAFLFPGQGSQYLGMGADLALAFPEATAVWDGLDGELAHLPGTVFPEPAFDQSVPDQNLQLTATANAQPAIAAASLAQLALLDVLGVSADAAAGHSFGEVTALAAAGALPRHRLIDTARVRGALMGEAGRGHDGAMLAVAVGAEQARTLLDSEPELAAALVIANDNAPRQVVLAGPGPDIGRATAATKAAGWTSMRLPVATAFHSRLVAASCAPFAAHLKTLSLQSPHIPVYANATARPYGTDVAEQLADQLCQPVRFRELIERMARDGITRFIEVGPGRVLTRLVAEILGETPHLAVALDDPKADGLRGWHRGLAALAADGVPLDLAALFDSYQVPDKPVPAPAHAVMVGGAPLGKPSAPAAEMTPPTSRAPRLVSPPPAAMPADAWSLVDRIRQETADQHQHYLDSMAQSHQAFLDMSVRMLAELTGQHPPAATQPEPAPPAPPAEAPSPDAPPVQRALPEPEAVTESAPPQSVAEVVVAIVSEKTGYPADMLGLDMEMEAELGIDSIKRVEILSALQARTPGAPDLPAAKIAALRTLQDVVDSVAELTTVAPEPPSPPPTIPTELCRSETTLRPVPASGFAMAGLRDGEVLITREEPEFADALQRAMTRRGIQARAVDDVPDQANAVICLAALSAISGPDACVEMHLRAIRAARSVARGTAASRLFVTVQSTGGAFTGCGAPVGVAGIVKCVAHEWANASVRAVDVESLDPERLTQELLAGGAGIEVALRADGTRLVVDDAVVAPGPGEDIAVAANGVVVVSGGARGVTAASALALAARHGLRLALLGRTRLPEGAPPQTPAATVAETAAALVSSARTRGESLALADARARAERLCAEHEIREALGAAERQGITARYFTADVTDLARLSALLEEIRRTLGPIVGVVHGAGVLADKRLEDLDDNHFLDVFRTKVIGAEALLDSTSTDDLRFISMFSSIAARTGNAGQCAYAAANTVLETIAARESATRGDTCVVRAFGWGPWDGGMVDATRKERFRSAGVGVIAKEDGAAFFAEHALRRSPAPASVVAAPAARRLPAARLQWTVSAELLPVLADHRVRDRIVLPVVIVLDAMLRATRGLVGDDTYGVRDFQVLSGVTFADPQQAMTLTFSVEAIDTATAVTVFDDDGRARYRAVLDGGTDTLPAGAIPEIPAAPWPLSVEDAYAGMLFHGPSFAAVEHLDAFGAAGCTGRVKGRAALKWAGTDGAIDPAAVDGGLQLCLLWANLHGYPLVLPQRIRRVVLHRPFPVDGPVQCRVAARPLGATRVDFDIAYHTCDDTPVAVLEGVESYAAGVGDMVR